MKKLPALVLACALALLCACSAADPAELSAARKSGAAGTWYADMVGCLATLTLNDDLSCALTLDRADFSYKGTWKISGQHLSLLIKSAVSQTDTVAMSMPEILFSYDGDSLTYETFIFRRELPSFIEIAPVRKDVTLSDFEGVWQTHMLCVNGFMMEFDAEAIPPSEFGADITVSIGTTSAAVDLPGRSDAMSFLEFHNAMTDTQVRPTARPDITYIFPLELVGNELKMTLDHMEMTAQLHTDGTMSITGITPLHDTLFPADASLIVYMRRAD